jgi:hypothetical protein
MGNSLTAKQVYQENPHFEGLLLFDRIRSYSVADLPDYTMLLVVQDSFTRHKASYLWNNVKSAWVLGAN